MSRRPHDALFKAGFERAEHAAGMLRGILPVSVADMIDWDTIIAEPGSFIDSDLADGYSDLLFTADVAFGGHIQSRAYLYLLLEHQSTSDPEMPLRMLSYMLRIWERVLRNRKPGELRPSLPLIVPIVISHAPGGWSAARDLAELLDPRARGLRRLRRFVPRFDLVIEDLAHLSNDDIKRLALAAFPKLVLGLSVMPAVDTS